jgi:hypothetical protein
MENLNILSAKYLQSQGVNSGILAIIDDIPMSVPLDPANRHYQAILKWVAEGNTIEDAD